MTRILDEVWLELMLGLTGAVGLILLAFNLNAEALQGMVTFMVWVGITAFCWCRVIRCAQEQGGEKG